MKKYNILSFSEYRVKNAIYIQKEISENQSFKYIPNEITAPITKLVKA